MRRIVILGALILTGCGKTVGPLEHYRDQTRVDDPLLTIPEQQQRGRDRMALPEPSSSVAPRTYAEFPGPHGR